MRDESNIWLSLCTSLVFAALLFQSVSSMDVRFFAPRLLELCVWILSSPATLGIFFAFAVGVLVNLIEGSYIGSASIGLSVVAYLLLSAIYTIRQLDWISQTAIIFLLLGISLALQRIGLAAVGVSSDGLSYLISVLVSAALWRPFNVAMDGARQWLGGLR